MTETLSPKEIDELRALLAKATPRPWAVSSTNIDDAQAIAALFNAAPALLAAAEQQQWQQIKTTEKSAPIWPDFACLVLIGAAEASDWRMR